MDSRFRKSLSLLNQLHIPVIIVGAGPVGLTLSILLSKLGVHSLLIEKRKKLTDHPQAHFINSRTMEIFRGLDGLDKEIETLQPPLNQWRRFVYCQSMVGRSFGSVDHFSQPHLNFDKYPTSPTNVAHYSQNQLLPLLLKRAKLAYESIPSPSPLAALLPPHTYDPSDKVNPKVNPILMNTQLTHFQSSPDHVQVRLSNASVDSDVTDPSTDMDVRCRYLIGTDGYHSRIRQLSRIPMVGEGVIQDLVNVHFRSPRLGQILVKRNPAMLYFVFNPDCVAVIVAHDLRFGEFVAQIPYYPPQQTFEDFSAKTCHRIIQRACGINDLEVEILSIKKWRMAAQVAKNFIFEQKIFIAGDSAHCFPPAGGFGMNTGIQDAHNLAWKIAAVMNKISNFQLLNTYHQERHQIAEENCELSLSNYKSAISIPKALGIDPGSAKLIQNAINSPSFSFLPSFVQKQVMEATFSLGLLQTSSLFLLSSNPIAQSRLRKVERMLKEGSSLQLQFPVNDVGFRYKNGAFVSDNIGFQTTEKKENAIGGSGNNEENDRKDEKNKNKNNNNNNNNNKNKNKITLEAVPGSRIPHYVFNCPFTNKGVSSLDFVFGTKLEFVLLLSPSNFQIWADSFFEICKNLKLEAKIALIIQKKDLAKHKHFLSTLRNPVMQFSPSSKLRDASADGSIRNEKESPNFFSSDNVPGSYGAGCAPCSGAHNISGNYAVELPYECKHNVWILEDLDGDFWSCICSGIECIILVRPDGHVAFRTLNDLHDKDPRSILHNAFKQILKLPS